MRTVWQFASSGLISAYALLLIFPAAIVELSMRGNSSSAVGLFAALQPLAMVPLIVFLPSLARLIGRVPSVWGGLIAGLIAIAILGTTDAYTLWLVGAMLIGITFAVHWTSIDTVLSENVPKDKAGTIIGTYQTLLAACIAAGPATVAIFGLPFDAALKASAVLLMIAAVPTLGAARRIIDDAIPPAAQGEAIGPFFLRNIGLAAAAILAGVFEVGSSAMGGVHALHLGYGAAAAVAVASIVAVGSFSAQVPVGWLADRYGGKLLMLISASVLFVSSFALMLGQIYPNLLWPIVFFWGAFGGALQTLVYMHVAISYRGAQVASGMAVMAIGFTIGSLLGPSVGGVAVDASAEFGLPLAMAGLALLLTLVLKRL
jgi:MFS family permease